MKSVAVILALFIPIGALAQGNAERVDGAVIYTTSQSFDDVVFGVENAIVNQGLVVDSTSQVGEMLARTRSDVGSDVILFGNAQVTSFCSAKLSREVMEADIRNIQFCPYDIFIYTAASSPDETRVGYREMPNGSMQTIENLLDQIVQDALGID